MTIAATPDPIAVGDPVLIYGQLRGARSGGRPILLFERLEGSSRYREVARTQTNGTGLYSFTEPTGRVSTNRSWFVTGPDRTRSRTVHEAVQAALTLTAPTLARTDAPVTFTGTVAPAGVHTGERVQLQLLTGDSGSGWAPVGTAPVSDTSSFTITHRFHVPGAFELRASFRADRRNLGAVSDSVTVLVQQAQNPTFTVATSNAAIDEGQSATISGRLFTAKAPTVPLPATPVALWARTAGTAFARVATGVTGADGRYSFRRSPAHSTVFQVRTATSSSRMTAPLFEGVRDVVTASVSSTSSVVGGTVTFSGVVKPDKTGHVIYLERLGRDGRFHIVRTGHVAPGSTYRFSWRVGSAGVRTFRVHIPGGPTNLGGSSARMTVTASMPPVSSLPPAS